jgi:hypothetical protein
MFIEKSDQSCEIAPDLASGAIVAFPQQSETSRMTVVFAERQDCL